MIHSFLLIGQSNMGGRGYLHEVAPICDDRLLVLRNGRWQKLYAPVNPDRQFSGVNLAESFALAYADHHPNVQVGLIPCADGGSSLEQWQAGGLLFDHAVYQCRLALRTSSIAGVLWHQGESECRPPLYDEYEEKFTKIMRALRREIGLAEDVPFLLGGLGDFLKLRAGMDPAYADLLNYTRVNDALRAIAAKNPCVGYVSADGLTANPEQVHFNAPSLRIFGRRYYQVFAGLENKEKRFPEKPREDGAVRTEMELL